MSHANAGESGRLVKYRSRIVKGPALQGHCRHPARAKMKVIASRRLARAGRLVLCFRGLSLRTAVPGFRHAVKYAF
jgi:hypothetical protein